MSIGGEIVEEYYEGKVLPIYKELLEECSKAFNEIQNTKLKSNKYKDTYQLVSNIDKLLKRNKSII